MKKLALAIAAIALSLTAIARAEGPASAAGDKKLTEATFLVTGLHCPPCTRTVETSLAHTKGVRVIKVDWKTKNARVQFDEGLVTAEGISHLISATRHMMGGNLHYGAWFALKVPSFKDEATGKRIQEALKTVEGVKQVALYPAQHAVGIDFSDKGNLSSQQIIDALAKEGIEAVNL